MQLITQILFETDNPCLGRVDQEQFVGQTTDARSQRDGTRVWTRFAHSATYGRRPSAPNTKFWDAEGRGLRPVDDCRNEAPLWGLGITRTTDASFNGGWRVALAGRARRSYRTVGFCFIEWERTLMPIFVRDSLYCRMMFMTLSGFQTFPAVGSQLRVVSDLDRRARCRNGLFLRAIFFILFFRIKIRHVLRRLYSGFYANGIIFLRWVI